MAGNMKDIQGRIKSVTSTKQITHAMQLVASAKMRRARERADARRAYTDYLIDTMHLISESLGKEEPNPLLRKNGSDRNLFLVVTSDKGLAGGFNSNLLKFALSAIGDKENAVIAAGGNKAIDFFRRRNFDMPYIYSGGSDEANFARAEEIADDITDAYINGNVGNVYVIYNRFKSVISQKPEIVKLLPLSSDEDMLMDRIDTDIESGEKERRETRISRMHTPVMLFEPSPADFIEQLLPQYVTNAVYGALLESAAGELASRRMAMENATDNADELIGDLSLKYNRARQGAITQEITEIAAGANAIGGGA